MKIFQFEILQMYFKFKSIYNKISNQMIGSYISAFLTPTGLGLYLEGGLSAIILEAQIVEQNIYLASNP